MIKYEIIKKNDDVVMCQNVDDFFKMQFQSIIDYDVIDDIDDCFQLSCNMNRLYSSYETFKNQLKQNDVNNYIIVYEYDNESIYVFDVETNNIFYVNAIDVFEFIYDFKLRKIENINEKYNLMCLFFYSMI